jgi:hypothetical protein
VRAFAASYISCPSSCDASKILGPWYLTSMQTSSIDFTEVAVDYPGQPLSVGTIFTISSCSRFLMVANGCLVYLYELNRSQKITAGESIISAGALRPVTSIICPHRVLACSMDTSSNRYAVAILLDGRMGLVCDINTPWASSPAPATGPGTNANSVNVQSPDRSSETGVRGTSFLDRVSLRTSAWTANPNHQVGRKCASSLGPIIIEGLLTLFAEQGTTVCLSWDRNYGSKFCSRESI